MLENKFFLLLINFLWMAGLFGALFALVYMAQYRRKHWWNIGYTYNVPRLLAPLYGSLLVFVLGLALHAYVGQSTVSLWVAIVWGVLALFFLFRAIELVFAALQSGWDSVLIGPDAGAGHGRGLPVWSGSVFALLLVNLLLLGWWGSVQLSAGSLNLPWMKSGLTSAQIAPTATLQLSAQQQNKHRQPTLQADSPKSAAIITATSTITIVNTIVPAVSTLDVLTLKITPTAQGELSSPTHTPVPDIVAVPVVTATAMLILVPTPTATTRPESSITVKNAIGANVRTAPDLTADIVTLLPDAAVAPVLERTADNQWFLIRLPSGAQGWISIQTVVFTGAIDLIPLMAKQ